MRIPLALGLAAIAAFTMACSPQSPSVDNASDDRISVRAFALQAETLPDTLQAAGMLTTSSQAFYSFKLGGVLAELLVENGDAVQKGQLLARLRPDEIDAGLAQAQLAYEKAERDWERVQRLFADSVATFEQYQNVTTARDLASRQLESARFNRRFAEIRAEAAGFVALRLANQGEVVAPGQAILQVQHSNNADWLLKVGLSDRDWVRLQTGDRAWVTLDAFPDQLLPARVLRKQRSLQAFSGALAVEIQLEKSLPQLASGLFGRVLIPVATGREVYRIPYDALVEANGSTGFVYVAKGSHGVEKRVVEIASLHNNEVWISKGLQQVAEVLVGNSPFLNEQSRIRIER